MPELAHRPPTMDAGFRSSHNASQMTMSASQLLQDRLEERRARNMRPKRSRQTDLGLRRSGRDDDIFLTAGQDSPYGNGRLHASSPVAAGARVPSEAGSGYSRRQSMGVRDMDEQLDRLSKQNFALKLELDHRRDHTARLQEQLEAMRAQIERTEQLEAEHAELLRINSELVGEMEKRDRAVQEAVDYICELEEKVTELEERRNHTRPSTGNADSGYAGTETHEQAPPSSPPEVGTRKHSPTSAPSASLPAASAASQPSFMSQKNTSTQALRNAYLEASHSLRPVLSFNSLLSKRESRLGDGVEDDLLTSPRLSVLSESSFPSLYSPKQRSSPDKFAWEAEADEEDMQDCFAHSRQDSIKRVSRWMEDRNVSEETPSRSTRVTSPLAQQLEQDVADVPSRQGEAGYQSLNDALSTATTAAQQQSCEQLRSANTMKPRASEARKALAPRQQRKMPGTLGGPVFGEPLLPPTPDSASTQMLRTSNSSIVGARALLDDKDIAAESPDGHRSSLRTTSKPLRSSVEPNGALLRYHNHQQRSSRLQTKDGDSSSDEDDDDGDARSVTVKDFSMDYDGFPDGGSIIMGMPSRFLKHGAPPATDTLDGGNDLSVQHSTPWAPQRRQSSSDATLSPQKPGLSRAETSPTFFGTLSRIVTTVSRPTTDGVTSPKSYHSGSSSNRTVVAEVEAERLAVAPRQNNRSQSRLSRTSPSPARSLSQKTQKFFRRMSNNHTESARQGRLQAEQETSPMTMVPTPSSTVLDRGEATGKGRPRTSEAHQPMTPAAVALDRASTGGGRRPSLQTRTQTEPVATPRPRTSEAHNSTTAAAGLAGGVSIGGDRRPSLQVRTQTEPVTTGTVSVATIEHPHANAGERKNPFRRSNSVRHDAKASVSIPTPLEVQMSVSRGATDRRRGSVREAGTTRKPWR
ncbi:hypothetical protein BAUCODRAFT_413912 [Baudoinia panamericana UAMH 10762]|uniref:HAMP domain-containing protein n=1 Tax=Baudoinia panamericana (strain UAMH 10762) TaxID=717646 RepID=M2MN70_BAUPA|nr:uncharacterized protein BAUCODRAFT_413912 [Baudoinia panamericana UAMH 10762]EMC98126.1 hypothetical protein BAUCODRAFT_413912 [Baudoinia panamericana UAMH 10762]